MPLDVVSLITYCLMYNWLTIGVEQEVIVFQWRLLQLVLYSTNFFLALLSVKDQDNVLTEILYPRRWSILKLCRKNSWAYCIWQPLRQFFSINFFKLLWSVGTRIVWAANSRWWRQLLNLLTVINNSAFWVLWFLPAGCILCK